MSKINLEKLLTLELNLAEHERYQRHFPLIGAKGQKILKNTKVLCVGAGGLGSSLLYYLTAMGIGTIGIIEFDTVQQSNLHRQILYKTVDLENKKIDLAVTQLRKLNPLCEIFPYDIKADASMLFNCIPQYDVIIDCTDNFDIRYTMNKICVYYNKPFLSASVYQWIGHCSVFNFKGGPCYQCAFKEKLPKALLPNCATEGLLGALPGIIGSIQATELVKLVLDLGDSLSGKLLSFDATSMSISHYPINKDSHCPICSISKADLAKLIMKNSSV